MILLDTNLLLYAEDSLSPHHEKARVWEDEQLRGAKPVGFCWPILTAFIRIGTNARLHKRPLTLHEALARVQSWLDHPCAGVVMPTEQHWLLFQKMPHTGVATANLVPDAHLAALAVEHNCTLASADADFARFRGLKWINPLVT